MDTAYQLPDLPRFRVNAFRQRGDISFAFRVIPAQMPDFRGLGLPPGVEKLAEEHRGLVLVTGATGRGKTTSLAAMLGHINRTRKQHIVSIEDPIEILHPDVNCIVNQREVGLDTDSFHEALRRVLRQDPDVILIGELRDAETAETALQAAESGHLVLSTMHTVDAAETVSRYVEFFPAVKQPQVRSILAGVLRGVVSQRLLPQDRRRPGRRGRGHDRNNRIQELIRDDKSEYIPEAVAEGAFFHMQTITQALIAAVARRSRRSGGRRQRSSEPSRLHDRPRPCAQGARDRAGRGRNARARVGGRARAPAFGAPGDVRGAANPLRMNVEFAAVVLVARPRDRQLPERRRRAHSAAAFDRLAGLGVPVLRARARLVRQHPARLVRGAARTLPPLRRVDLVALSGGRGRRPPC